MTFKEIASMIDSAGIPNAYNQFDETGQEPPYICFIYSGSNDMMADQTNYQKIEGLRIELYTDEKDFELEEKVEAALNGAGLVYTRNEIYIESEQLYQVVYEADVLITQEV